jgi:anti-sigma factor RsiW
MSRDELQMQLMPYADGELGPAEARAFEAAIADHPDLQQELASLRDLNAFTRLAFDATAPDVPLDGVFSGVMARLGDEASGRAATPGFAARVGNWLQGFFAFERPMALAGFAAAIVATIGYFALGADSTSAPSAPASIAETTPKPGARRGAETEMKPDGKREAVVRFVEVEPGGLVRIDEAGQEGDKPLVLWHVIDGEGVAPPEGTGL